MIERVANRTLQWAEALERSLAEAAPSDEARRSGPREELLRRETASLFAIAGSYRLLLSASDAVEPLRRAGKHLSVVGSLYAHALAVCSADDDADWLLDLDESERPLSPSDRAFLLLRLGWLDASSLNGDGAAREGLFQHFERAASVAPTEVGRLRVPLDATIRVLRSVDEMVHDNAKVDAVTGPLRDFLRRAHDVTAVAMDDRYHWRNLLSSVLPVEPEAAAVGAVVMAGAIRRDAERELIERLDLPIQALAPLIVGGTIAELRL